MIPLPSNSKVREAIFKKYFDIEEWEDSYSQVTAEHKRMAEYAGCSMLALKDLPISLYLLIKRDSWLESMRATEAGREFLKVLWRLKQTKADIVKIRERKGVLKNE